MISAERALDLDRKLEDKLHSGPPYLMEIATKNPHISVISDSEANSQQCTQWYDLTSRENLACLDFDSKRFQKYQVPWTFNFWFAVRMQLLGLHLASGSWRTLILQQFVLFSLQYSNLSIFFMVYLVPSAHCLHMFCRAFKGTTLICVPGNHQYCTTTKKISINSAVTGNVMSVSNSAAHQHLARCPAATMSRTLISTWHSSLQMSAKTPDLQIWP